MNRPARRITLILALAVVAAGVNSLSASADAPAPAAAPTTRPVKLPFLTQPLKAGPEGDAQPSRPVNRLKPPRADLRIRNRDAEEKPLTAAQTRALDLPPLADTPNLPSPPRIVMPEKPRHKLDPLPERPFALPAMAVRPRWSVFLPAPGIQAPSALDGKFAPIQPMVREYIPDTAPTALTPEINLGTRAEFDGISDDDIPAIRTDLPSRPGIPK